ncbi:MAG: type I-E CRISPR-associated protein Cas5/CasD [Lentisphaerae bacterium RIFOXYB12_FULL_65_16]|nr:MAG: type I-E CRISPR-associated protein Cas5/CasD [Lentisphaerae bacterium RIFOXYA12_64_32]OGV94033.1 MAG: type I-E CRISPR-associated protein Cas5/CasD [Lentisphaerae bacterium RIFOXYB12_FULL_65_16]
MSTEHVYLALMLDAPLMSFGHSSRFQRRTTALHPTRSGILGMICAALGAAKGSSVESEWLARLDGARLTVLAIPRRPDGAREPLPIRRLDDYHTVEGTRNAENKIKKDAVLSHRQYLLDARFGAIMEGPRAVLEPVADALRNPHWGIWFGRKCCIPAAPVFRKLAATFDEAMATLDLASRDLAEFAVVTEAPSFDEGTDTLMDAPVSFATREFKPRRICQTPPVVPPGERRVTA